MANAPIVKITVDDPRRDGRITSPGGGWEVPPIAQVFDLKGGTEIVHGLKGIGQRGSYTQTDMLVSEWQSVGANNSWDALAIPAGMGGTKFLRFYDGRPNASGGVQSLGNFTPCWEAKVVRAAIPYGNTLQRPDWSIKMIGGGLGYPSWRLVFPANAAPYLSFDPYSTGHAVRVSECPADASAGADNGLQRIVVRCQLDGNCWSFGLTVNGVAAEEPWHYMVPGVDIGDPTLLGAAGTPVPVCSDGPLRVQTQGQALMFGVWGLDYSGPKEAYQKSFYTVDTRFGDVTRTTAPLLAEGVVHAPTGTACNVKAETNDANGFGVRLLFGSAGPRRAVCGTVGVRLPAVIGDTTTDPWVNSSNWRPDDVVTYTRRATWRGSELHATFRDPTGAIDWTGNEACKLEVAQDNGGDPVYNVIGTYYLTGPSRDKDGGDPLAVTLDAMDAAGTRLNNIKPVFMRSLGGFDFALAFQEIGNALGFASDRIVLTDCTGLTLPTPQVIGDPMFLWGDQDEFADALDAICKAVGRTWGIDKDGNLFARPFDTDSGEPYVFELDSTTTTPNELIGSFTSKRDMEQFVNEVFTITGEDGFRQIAWARNLLSQDTPGAGFVGSPMQAVERLEKTVADAATIATITLGKRAKFADTLIWSPILPQPTVLPGSFVKVNIANAQLTANGIYYVTEERGEVRPGSPYEGGWRQTFTCVKV